MIPFQCLAKAHLKHLNSTLAWGFLLPQFVLDLSFVYSWRLGLKQDRTSYACEIQMFTKQDRA